MVISLTNNSLDVELANNLAAVLNFGDHDPFVVITSGVPNMELVADLAKQNNQDQNPVIMCIGIGEEKSASTYYDYLGVKRIHCYELIEVNAHVFQRLIEWQVAHKDSLVNLDMLHVINAHRI